MFDRESIKAGFEAMHRAVMGELNKADPDNVGKILSGINYLEIDEETHEENYIHRNIRVKPPVKNSFSR